MLPIKNLRSTRVRLAAGATYDRFDAAQDGDFYGGSVFLTGRTLVGP